VWGYYHTNVSANKADWMKFKANLIVLLALPLIWGIGSVGKTKADSGIWPDAHGVLFQQSNSIWRITVERPNIVRVQCVPVTSTNAAQSLMISPDYSPSAAWHTATHSNGLFLYSDRFRIIINTNTAAIEFGERNHDRLFVTGISSITETNVFGATAHSINQQFLIDTNQALYGLGQSGAGVLNLRGRSIRLVQENTRAVSPIIVSSRGYAILWDNYSESWFTSDTNGMSFQSEIADGINYYVILGPDFDEIVEGYRTLTGSSPLYPKWAYGFIQSWNWYTNQAEVISIVDEYRRRELPLDVIVQDAGYWERRPDDRTMAPVMSTNLFPDPAGMTDLLETNYNCQFMISLWPYIGTSTTMYVEMKNAGHFFRIHSSPNTINLYDPFNAGARAMHWKWLNTNLFAKGIDAWWMDATEPELSLSILKQSITAMGPMARYLNAYSLMAAKGVYEGQRGTSDQKRVFNLSRSVYAGQQRYGAATWSGDIRGTWDTLREQVAEGLNYSISGFPYWTADIGGYFADYSDGTTNNEYRNLYVRWFQFGAFLPLFRAHGGGIRREIWQFGEPGSPHYDAMAKFSRLRSRLMHYIYSTAWNVTDNAYTMLRALPFDYNTDPRVRSIGNQYKFGPAIMVSPLSGPTNEIYQLVTKNNIITNGFLGEYFNGRSFGTLALTRVDDVVDFTWPAKPWPEINSDDFSIRWTGSITAQKTGLHYFRTLSDDGVRLWVDDQLIINNWRDQAPTYNSGVIPLVAGEQYALKLEYYEKTGGARIQLAYRVSEDEFDRDITARSVYLPRGRVWYDFWTGQKLLGGQTIPVSPPIDKIPLHVPGGSIIPMGPVRQYVTESPNAPIELRVYPGADASFDLYEDENDTYNYEKGAYALIPIRWNNAARTLHIDNRQGEFPGMRDSVEFRVVIVSDGHGVGLEETTNNYVSITYDGSTREVGLSATAQCFIENPLHQNRYLEGSRIIFNGYGPDFSTSNLAWVSDRQGILGRGPFFSATNLHAGRHQIILVQSNAQGVVASAGIWIDVMGDANRNLLPDEWEVRHWPEMDGGSAIADDDGDCFMNWEELLADTNPRDSASYFQPITVMNQSEQFAGMQISIDNSSTSRLYGIYGKTNLMGGSDWQLLGGEFVGSGGSLSILITNHSDFGFYRTGARPVGFFQAPSELEGYVVDFENTNKSSYASQNILLNGISWNLTDVLIGSTSSDWKNGARSARLRGYGTSAMTMQEDLPVGLGSIAFSYRRYGTDPQVDWQVQVSTNGGIQWFNAGDAFKAPDSNDVRNFTYTTNITGRFRIRIIQSAGVGTSNQRLSIDDIMLKGYREDCF
jgi:alpha-D-xyloside xylohydrolase